MIHSAMPENDSSKVLRSAAVIAGVVKMFSADGSLTNSAMSTLFL